MAVIGVGIDVCDIGRFARVLERTPDVAARLFTVAERSGLRVEQLAARFAAKEAVAKALGVSYAGPWHDVEITGGQSRRPGLTVGGAVGAAAAALGIERWHLSLSHDAGVATAVVIAEGSR